MSRYDALNLSPLTSTDPNGNGTVPPGGLVNGHIDHIDWPSFGIHHVIIDCSMMAFIDSVGAKCLKTVSGDQ